MGKKLLGGATSVLGTAAAVVRHVTWYVNYQLEGRTRDAEEPPSRG